MRWEFASIGANPFGNRLIRIDKGRRKKRRSLTLEQLHALLQHRLIAEEPFRTMVIVAICLGLRCSEIFGLRWADINWEALTLDVQRGIVAGVLDETKSQTSEGTLPIAAELAEVLWQWKRRSPFNAPEDFVFADPDKAGRAPYDPSSLQRSRLRPAGKDIGFSDSLGWHTFRHTYRTFLDETGAPMSAQQELMRHADIRTTFEYGEALTPSKRKANLKVVKMVLAGPKSGKRKNGGRR
jgi:integrase